MINRRGFFGALAAPLLTKPEAVSLQKVSKLTSTIVVNIDGRKLAEIIAIELPKLVRRHGLA
jgi:hypothetical protein